MALTTRDNDSISVIRPRSKRACQECNFRRVRCNVCETRPCSNCESAGSECKVLPSQRGRYPRKRRSRLASSAQETSSQIAPISLAQMSPPFSESSFTPPQPDCYPQLFEAQSLFFGGSDPVTYADVLQRERSVFPFSNTIPQRPDIATLTRVQYLQQQGALTFPDISIYLPALRAYFTRFHPCFPVVDRVNFSHKLNKMEVSPFLLQAMLFIGANYCEKETIFLMGFGDRAEGKFAYYQRARLLFEAEWERDPITVLQGIFLLSFWTGEKNSTRDSRYWLGTAITLAQNYGLHRSTRFQAGNYRMESLRRRIWWSIYICEQQHSVSSGLPRRLRNEDCDIEPLAAADLEEDLDESVVASLGVCGPIHAVYMLKMLEFARLLGNIIDIQFTPMRESTALTDLEKLKAKVESWTADLPANMHSASDQWNTSIWSSFLQLAYNYLQILIYRNGFLRDPCCADNLDRQAAVDAACRVSRIAEDMLSQGIIQFSQPHVITSLFAALGIHFTTFQTSKGVYKRLAGGRAQSCLLGLKEIQEYWGVNNTVLKYFFQNLDQATTEAFATEKAGFAQESLLINPDFGREGLDSTTWSSAQPLAHLFSVSPTEDPAEDECLGYSLENPKNWNGSGDGGEPGCFRDARFHTTVDGLERYLSRSLADYNETVR